MPFHPSLPTFCKTPKAEGTLNAEPAVRHLASPGRLVTTQATCYLSTESLLKSLQSEFSLKHPVQQPQLALVSVKKQNGSHPPQLTERAFGLLPYFKCLMIIAASEHIWRELGPPAASCPIPGPPPRAQQTLQVQTGYTVLLHVRAEASNNQGFFFFFFWRNDQTRGWGQNFLQETAS